jgi:hypothetical protein
MDIHKPKPWHGWRELLKEIGTIILGILIALGLEQAAEQWKWHRAVAEARTAIHEEIAFNNGFFQYRDRAAPCVAKRLDEIERALKAAKASGEVQRVPGAALALSFQLVDSQWQGARAAQTLAHFPHDELATLGRYYDVVQTYKLAWLNQEGEDWRWLADLKDGPHKVAPSDLTQLRYRLRSARALAGVLAETSRRQVEAGETLGVKPVPRNVDYLRQICAGPEG